MKTQYIDLEIEVNGVQVSETFYGTPRSSWVKGMMGLSRY